MRPIYRRRRDTLLESLARLLPGFRPAGAPTGLHVLALIPPGPAGLIFGYGAAPEAVIDDGIRRLADVVRGLGSTPASAPAPSPAIAGAPDRPVVAVYGTLRRGQRNHELMAPAEHLGTGLIAGSLHEMPATADRAYGYPALLEDEDEDEGVRVVVEVYRLPDTATLARLDELEAYDPADEAGSEYVRRDAQVLDGPLARAWVYVFNGDPATIGGPVPDGDWVAFTRAGRGAPAARGLTKR